MAGIDASDLYRFAAQISRVKDEIPKGARAAVQVALHTGKDAWQAGLESSDVPASASTLWYRLQGNAASAGGTIEPTRGTARLQGYVHAREYGSPTVAPAAPAAEAARIAGEDLVRGLGIAGERAAQRALES